MPALQQQGTKREKEVRSHCVSPLTGAVLALLALLAPTPRRREAIGWRCAVAGSSLVDRVEAVAKSARMSPTRATRVARALQQSLVAVQGDLSVIARWLLAAPHVPPLFHCQTATSPTCARARVVPAHARRRWWPVLRF